MRLKDRQNKTDGATEKSASFSRLADSFFPGPEASSVVPKTASDYTDDASINECAQDSRKRRLAELLKKREHSGTATGSASPNPPRGS